MEVSYQVQNRRAIEAMRAGVPNQDVVHIMGCAQEKLESHFSTQSPVILAPENHICWNIFSTWLSNKTSFAANS